MENIDQCVKGVYDAVDSHDPAGILSRLSQDVVFHVPGTGPLAGEYRGTAAIGELVQRVMASTGGTFRMELIQTLSNDRTVVSLHRWSASWSGDSIAMNNFNVWRFDESDLICERWEFIEDQAAHDTFWKSVLATP